MKHFIFDMGEVLVKPIQYELLKDEINYVNCDSEETKEYFMNAFLNYERGFLDTNSYVKKMQPYFNKKDLTAEEFETTYYEIDEKYGGVFENAYTELKELKDEGYKVYLLSNIHEIAFKNFKKIFDIDIFDKLFLSYEMGMVKLDNQIYQKVIKTIGDRPKEMCFFDDQIRNVEAAKSNGINAFQTTGDTLHKNISIAKKL